MPINSSVPQGKATLNDWADAHRLLMEAERNLIDLADRVAAQESSANALEMQRARVAALQEHAEAVYELVMEDLRRF
jgi:hypothetical protein